MGADMLISLTKNAVNGVLRRSGYEVRRIRSPVEWKIRKSNAFSGQLLEFVAPAGSGKSFMIRQLRPHLPAGWTTSRSALNHVDATRLVASAEPQLHDLYRLLLHKKFERFRDGELDQRCLPEQLVSMSFYCENALHNLALDTGLPFGVVNDEGLCWGFWREIVSMRSRGMPDHLAAALKRRKIVLLVCEPETILANIKKRRIREPARRDSNFIGYSDAEVVNAVENEYRELSQFLDFVEPHCGGVLRLSSADTEACCRQIGSFVEHGARTESVCRPPSADVAAAVSGHPGPQPTSKG